MNENNYDKNNMNLKSRIGSIICIVLIFACAGYFIFGSAKKSVITEISYTEFLEAVKKNQIEKVVIVGEEQITGSFAKNTGRFETFSTIIPYSDTELMPLLKVHNVAINGAKPKVSIFSYLMEFLPLIFMIFLIFMLFRQSSTQNARSMQFGKSRARRYDGSKKILFKDVAGQEEAKYELAEIVDFLKNPMKYLDLGAKIPKGVLLVGSPGTGKTLLARAVAGEAGVNFLHISGSDFVEMFVGVGASRVRDLFADGRRSAPCIIFIDELDAVGRARGAGFGGGHDERVQTLNQMLVEMDGFDSKEGVIVLAATNRPDVLDPALLRPGRFDRQVVVSLPDIKEREAILNIHGGKIPVAKDVDFNKFARATPGMSGADLANMVNEAALFAARKSKKFVENEEFEEARDKILMGVARKTMVLPEKEREMTACHEAGHALPYYYLKNVSPLHKVTIIPRGRALGLTIGLPEEDRHSHTKSMLLDELVIMFGGYAAEQVVYGDTTTGTQNDIQQATNLAHRMVCEWGMADEIGAVSYGQEDEPIFMGKEIARHKDYSENTAHEIDEAVKKLLDQARQKAVDVLTTHRDQLDMLSAALIERETLDDAEIRELLHFGEAKDAADKELKLADFVVFDNEEGKPKAKAKRKPRQPKPKAEESVTAESAESEKAAPASQAAEDAANEEQSLF